MDNPVVGVRQSGMALLRRGAIAMNSPRGVRGGVLLAACTLGVSILGACSLAPEGTDAERAKLGIGDGTVRISVGLEDVEDIVADLMQALGG